MSCHIHAKHEQPIDFNGNCVMLHFSCSGVVGKLNTCCQVPPLAYCLGTLLMKKALSKADVPFTL